VLLIHILALTSLFVGLVNEVACLREENARVVGECTRLMEESNQLAQDHAQLLERSKKITEELKAKNLELNSRCWLSWSQHVSI
jgi:methyl-accepting chemotaxis protein